jgi:hypothetical protein
MRAARVAAPCAFGPARYWVFQYRRGRTLRGRCPVFQSDRGWLASVAQAGTGRLACRPRRAAGQRRAAIRRSNDLIRLAVTATARAWRRSALARMPRSSRPTRPVSRGRSCSPVMAELPAPSWVARTTVRREKPPCAPQMKRLAPQSVPCASEVDASARSPRVGFALLSSGRDRWPQGQLERAYSDLGGKTRSS